MAQRSKLRVFRDELIYRALQLFAAIGCRIPLPIGRKLGVALGALACRILGRERAKAMRSLAIAFPEKSIDEHARIVRAMFRHLGMALFEIFWLPNLTPEKVRQTTVFEGLEHLDAALADGTRGVVVFTGHCGNWEWLGAAVAVLGYDVTVIAREIYQTRLNEFITENRASCQVKTIARGSESAAKQLLQTLRRHAILGALIDQRIKAENVDVPFFGVATSTPVGPAKLAIRTGAAAVAIFGERRGGMQHIRVSPPVYTTRDMDAAQLTADMTFAIEQQIRRVPEQWVWMHERWKK